jgi:hypothetical protein
VHLCAKGAEIIRGDNLAEDVFVTCGEREVIGIGRWRFAERDAYLVPGDEIREVSVLLLIIEIVEIGKESATLALLVAAFKRDES